MTYAEQLRAHEMEIARLDQENRAMRDGLNELRAICRGIVERVLVLPAPAVAGQRKCKTGKGGAK